MVPNAGFELLPMEVVHGNDALEIAQRAWEEQDARWVPITLAFAAEVLQEGNVIRTDLGVRVITRSHAWDKDTLCQCLLQSGPAHLGVPALLRIMTFRQHMAWLAEVFDGRSAEERA